MSVTSQTPYKKYTAAPGATVFATTFRVVLATDLKVTVDGVVVTSGFTLSTLGVQVGLDVTFTTPMVGGEVVEFQRIIPKSRATDYQQLGNFDAATVNADIDRLWMSNQELGEEIDRAVKVPIGSTIDPDQLIEDLLATEGAAAASAAAAAASQASAIASAAAAAASAATTGLPGLTGKALNLLRVKADESGYETRTPAQTLTDIGGVLPGAVGLTASALGCSMINGVLVASVLGNALTIAIKTKAGADPSAADPVLVLFRNTTAATGDYTVLTLTAATSHVASSGSTRGTTSGVISRLWVVGFNDAGTFRLGDINCRDSTLNIFPLSEGDLVSSTAEGGAGAADSAGVFYTGTAVTSKAYSILGYVESTQGTAGTWATPPSKIQLFGPGIHKPGEVVQTKRIPTGTLATTTAVIPYDNTIPQISEGFLAMTVPSLTPTSGANVLEVDAEAALSAAALSNCTFALFRDAVTDSFAAAGFNNSAADYPFRQHLYQAILAGSTAATSITARIGTHGGTTLSFNGQAGIARFGGVSNSYARVSEIMA